MNTDLADDGPFECEWCGEPAIDFTTKHVQLRPGQPPRRIYMYLCPPCHYEAEQEANWSRAQ